MKLSAKIGFSVFLICILYFAGSCGKSAYSASGGQSYAREMPAASYDMARYESSAEQEKEGVDNGSDLLAEGNIIQSRKLVKSANLRLRAEDPGTMEKPLSELMRKYGAWPASTGIYENSRNYSIRVPSPSYDVMLSELEGLGKMLRRTENAEDVTLRYYDLESRLATKRELLKTYQGYLGKAADISEIMTVESRIADLQREIDQTGTQFRNLASLVDYSTIDLEIVGPVSASSYSEPTLGEKLKELFSSFSGVASGALVVLTGIIIYGIPAALIIILLFWILFGRVGLLKKLWRLAARK